MKVIMLILAGLLIMSNTYADVSIFTEHEVIRVLRSDVYDNDRAFKDKPPYIGTVGLMSQHGNFTYSGGYTYKSDRDLYNGDEYDYSGVFLKLKYVHCIYKCR